MRVLSAQDVKDILVGCTILGTGGGGSLDEGLTAVAKAFECGKEFRLLDFDEIDDEGYYINPYYCGCIEPESETIEPGIELMSAIGVLEEYMGTVFDGVVSIEYGGGNTGQAMAAAAMMNKCMVDGDAAGRAVPELQFSTYYITGRSIYPFSIATKYGDQAVFLRVKDDVRAEALSRYMAVGSGGSVGMADHPIKGRLLKESIIPHALSYAGSVGRAQREAAENGLNPIEEILKAADGFLMFEGTVTKGTEWEIKNGFTEGTIVVENESQDNLKIWYKNENMVSWKNGNPYITCPDLICVVDRTTGYPVTNPDCKQGMEVAVLAFPAHPFWKTKKGLSILNPRFFGFDMDCGYIEDFRGH